jgi:hypothetical protein
LAVDGQFDGTRARVQFEVASPMTLVTTACTDEAFMASSRVTLVDPLGGAESWPLIHVDALRVGDVRLAPFEAALVEGRQCEVVLGADLLGDVALQVDPAARVLSLVPARTREGWLEYARGLPGEVQLVELTRDPRHDWPLVAVRVAQGPNALTAPFLFSTRQTRSRVLSVPAGQAGLKAPTELFEGVTLPKDFVLPTELVALRDVPYDAFELSPGFGVHAGSLERIDGDAPGLAGVVGADVWGHFEATIDLAAQVVVLHRPRLLEAGTQARCERGALEGEEACYALAQTKQPQGVLVSAAVWRPLAEGGRLYLDVTGPTVPCRLGLSFGPGDRGRSTQHLFPWPRLKETMPACAEALSQATAVSFGLFDEPASKECPGVCAFVEDLKSGRVSCECQPHEAPVDDETQKRFLELYKRLLEGGHELEQEPADPP